ncbi:MAG: hypothetical protein L0Y57_12480 [Beijerinckiaceae bacterium]|nr:hypothetical protein [Beijerinckiaceae bacterium]
MERVLIALAALITMATAANAATLAAGGIFAGTTQNTAVCYIYNSGTTAVSIVDRRIIQQFVGPVPLTVNQCGASLAAGAICGIAANAVNNAPYACKFDVIPSAAAVRGVLELRNGLTVLKNVDLR